MREGVRGTGDTVHRDESKILHINQKPIFNYSNTFVLFTFHFTYLKQVHVGFSTRHALNKLSNQ